MHIDAGRRIGNTDLPHYKALMPVFEAISNSVHALDDLGRSRGQIHIKIERSNPDLSGTGSVSAVHISDQGIGFTSTNYEAFNEADTAHKKSRGGKGVGRFLWLVAFERARIESTYFENGWWRRTFDFSPSRDGIEHPKLVALESPAPHPETVVSLLGLKESFSRFFPRTLDMIAARIAEHFLPLLFDPGRPEITVSDDASAVSVNAVFAETFEANAVDTTFSVCDFSFTLRHVLNTGGRELPGHRIHYCAHSRGVQSDSLTKLVPSVPKSKILLGDTLYYYVGLVSGGALDSAVNSQRTVIDLPEDDTQAGLAGGLTWSRLRDAVRSQVNDFLAPALSSVIAERIRRVEQLAQKEPQYHYLLKNHREAIEQLPADVTDEAELDRELRKIEFNAHQAVRRHGERLATMRLATSDDLKRHRDEYARYVTEEHAVGQAALAKYVVHRRAILDVVRGLMGVTDTGSFAFEEMIHDIVCPIRSTSRDPDFSAHNLWLINDQLEFHAYLASDKFVDKMEDIAAPDHVRPDLLVYNRKLVFADEAPFTSMVIVEFKKPQRDDYTLTKNPVAQIIDYVDRLRQGKVKDAQGRFIDFPDQSPCYGYAICDSTPTLKNIARKEDWEQSLDGEGFHVYRKNLRLHIEVLSYNKMVEDARKRNRILFEKLGLPTR